MPVALIDVLAGQHLKTGILMAMLNRERTGQGSLVRVSLLDAALTSLVNQSAAFLKTSQVPKPMGTLHPSIAPYGECFETADGKKFVIAVGSDAQFDTLLGLVGLEKLRVEGAFRLNKQRVDNRAVLFDTLSPCFQLDSRENWMKLFLENGIPAGAIYSLDEVFSQKEIESLLVKSHQEGEELISVKISPLFFEE
jgi:crotonobetainyl-CoA:carnitine CoA-transferase CaiB-like acyl-CoA transferase